MKSIKPGRGPSMMGAVSALIAALFGVFWTVMAVRMGAPFFFAIFGILFVVMGLAQAWYNFRNATGKNRFSTYDIVTHEEEIDPLDPRYSREETLPRAAGPEAPAYCPYCGEPLQGDYKFCPACGKQLP